MRRPVKAPGPVATASRSIRSRATPACSSARAISPGSRSPCVRDSSPGSTASMRSPSATATLPPRVVVSRARMIKVRTCVPYGAYGAYRHRILVPFSQSCPNPHPHPRRQPPPAESDAGDEAVLRREAPVSPRAAVFPDGRFLRDVLRGRAGGVARARSHADVAIEGRVGHRGADVRRAVSRGRRLHRAAGEEGLSRRDLRADRKSEDRERRRQARRGARRLAGHADRRGLSRRARSRRS